jgi:hypothetical protein
MAICDIATTTAAAAVQELVLRYEALSLAVSQLHTQSQQLQQSSQSLATHGQGVPAETQQQQQQSAYTVGTGRDSPSHLLASRQPEKAHEPMFGAAQLGTEPAQGPATAALLQVNGCCPFGSYAARKACPFQKHICLPEVGWPH